MATSTDVLKHDRTFKNPTRLQRSVLTGLEKRCLLWLAARMPRQVNSDHLTALAFVAMVLAGLSFWLASVTPAGLLLVVLCLAANWFGDSLDGTIARVRGHERPRYGYYVDHVVDVAGTAVLLTGMALSGFMTPLVAAAVLVAYLMVSAEVYLATVSLGTFRMSYWGIGPTELRILLAIGALTLLVRPHAGVLGHTFLLFDLGGVIAAVGLLGTFVSSAIQHTRRLYDAEPLPRRAAQ